MSIDLEQFHAVFFEESFEGLADMESGLLNLDLGDADSEVVNTIFRAAHSIKGGSGTFGFMQISSFTHVMETLLDEVREGKRSVTQEAVDLFLASVDVLRNMLSSTRDGTDPDVERVAQTQAALEAMLKGETAAAVPTAADNSPEAKPEITGWHIVFKPFEHMLKTGNDDIRLIRELAALGEMNCVPDLSGLPELQDMDPENAYLSWEIELRGSPTRDEVSEIFDWVDGDCELEIAPLGAIEPQQGSAETEPVQAPLTEASPVPERRETEDRRKPAARRTQERRKEAAPKEAGSIRVGTDKVDALINLVGELVITQSMLSRFGGDYSEDSMEPLRDGLAQLERNTRELQESVMQVRMLPISFSFNRFPRLVRDLSGKLGKKVELRLNGETTEVDKTVLEKIGDPLVHLVRNSLDHGLESPETRRAGGKAETGVIELNAFHEGGHIVIEVVDDGAGLPRDKILDKAVERGLVGADEELTDERIYNLIFQPGFSTADQVSDVSGRGVGMDVVRRNIMDLGGNVCISSRPGQGSTITISLPLTLAILDGQLIRVGDETFIISLVSILESLQVRSENLKGIASQAELYRLRDDYIPVIRLYEHFGVEPESTRLENGLLVVVEAEGCRVGVFVDELLGQQQVVIKSLETNFRQVDGISGATILGDGTVALIVDVPGLVHDFFEQSNGARKSAVA